MIWYSNTIKIIFHDHGTGIPSTVIDKAVNIKIWYMDIINW